REGRHASAVAALAPLLATLEQFDYFSQPPQLMGADILRLAGELDRARDLLTEGMSAATTRRYELPLLQFELAGVERLAGNSAASRLLLAQARRGMLACQMTLRATWPL